MKKLLALLLCLALLATGIFVLAACKNDGDENTYDITVWVGEGTKDLTEQQIAKFNETNEWGVTFNATVEIVSESKAIGDASSKQQSAGDIICFAQDQLARAVRIKLLAPLNSASVTAIEKDNDQGSIDATKIGGTIRAFPMTADNGYFMFYDKSVITDESHLNSLEDLIADCEAAGRNFSMNLTETGGGWYAASFFYATGCKSEWTTDDSGNFTAYDDTFKSDEGLIALQGMQKLLSSKAHIDSDKVSDFSAGTPSAVVVSGIWDYNAAKATLRENLGVAPLPSFTVGEKSYQLVSYLGHKLMGVKQQNDPHKALYLQKLAMYLTGAECQLQRFQAVGWGPSIKDLQANSDVKASPSLAALAASKTVLQGQYPSNWWSEMVVMTGSAYSRDKGAASESALQGLLNDYFNALPGLKIAQDD